MGEPKTVWYIVFCEADSNHWFLDRLRFGHIYAVRSSLGGSMWGFVNPTTTGIQLDMMPKEVLPNVQDYTPRALEVIRCVDSMSRLRKFTLRFGPLTCVTLIKLILGVNKWFVYTPGQLRKYLLNDMSGEIVWQASTK